MHPLWIVLIGVVIVIGGVLVLRLHAFLALVLAALAAGALTPRAAIERFEIEKKAVSVVASDAAQRRVVLELGEHRDYLGSKFVVLRPRGARGELQTVASVAVESFDTVRDKDDVAMTVAVAFVSQSSETELAPVQQRDIAIDPQSLQAAQSSAKQPVGERVANAFGSTCAKIGILIAMAAIIGKCLLDSGAADKIVRWALRVFGESRAPAAFVGSGFLLGIPVFFDTVFYLMIPLGKALRMRTGRNYLLYVLSIVAGGTMAHSLVPPTPGPLFVAEELSVDLGLMILAGTVVGLCASTAAYFFAQFANNRLEIPLRESADFSLKDLEELSQRDESQLPPLLLSLLPIVLPVLLIAGYTVLDMASKAAWLTLSPGWKAAAAAVGNKNIALVISAMIAMGMLAWQKRASLQELAVSIQGALASGGVIILITSAGGAFGGVIQQTGVASLIGQLQRTSPLIVLVLAFGVAAAIRTAQGSATVSMITSVGVLAGLAGQLSFHPVYLALAIGCGSKPIAWMNDSGFWVICKMSGMTEAEALKTITPMSIVMGLTGLVATVVLAALLPLR